MTDDDFIKAYESQQEIIDELVGVVKLFESVILYEINKAEHEGDDEGARLKTVTLNMCRDLLAKAKGE